ncbi:transcription termination factor 5, mitochondrial [Spodoptera frugiperda]|uniref:Transcription termination factor 5, mitochondrial n=1 Tax=Spodoptera frugiperda TaxID=7108 RepID=A0A9R0EFB7_SPOFR|nr:transcription termination factor 5, mitochondrial [Spodoptera frugiperda]
MRLCIKSWRCLSAGNLNFSHISHVKSRRYSHGIPFLDFYKKTTGTTISGDHLTVLQKKHPHIMEVTHDSLQCTLQILQKFGITAEEACSNLHVFSMNPITMENYGDILRECHFVTISAKQIIKYHTFIRKRTIAWLKKEGLLSEDIQLEQVILDKFQEWPESGKTLQKFCDTKTSVLTIRMSILERFLSWKLAVSQEEFQKYCRNYLPLQHKPMSDIQEAIRIAENDIKFDKAGIRRNGFVIAADPLHTKLILENVSTLAGMDIREVLKIEPAILKNNYNSIIQVRNILEEYRISEETQRKCLKVYCMRPETVRERLDELRSLKEYKVLSTNPRMLLLVIHKKKMLNRLTKIESAKKQCFSFNHLVSSSKVFHNYISSFGDKVCGRDIAILISSSLQLPPHDGRGQAAQVNAVLNQLRRHKYWLHVAMSVIDENIQFLRNKFDHQIIINNCLILLYPVSEVKYYIETILSMRSGREVSAAQNDELNYSNVRYDCLTDAQILSLVLYSIEKKYHFSGDGIWCRQDGLKVETQKN